MIPKSTRRWQFSLRGLLLAMGVVGLWMLIATRAGWIEAAGVAVSMSLAVVYVLLKGHREAYVLRPTAAIAAVLILWISAVDYVQHFVGCKLCSAHWRDREVRVSHCPVLSIPTRQHASLESQILEDLGTPCQHQLQRNLQGRIWGIVMFCPTWRTYTCICFFGTKDWQHDKFRNRVRKMKQADPTLATTFHERLIVNRDLKYLRTFLSAVRQDDKDVDKMESLLNLDTSP